MLSLLLPYRSMLANPTKQQQSPEIPISSPPYAQLSNLEAVYAVLPNEHTITVDPNMPELLKRLTAHDSALIPRRRKLVKQLV